MPPLREGHLIHFPCMLSYHPKVNGDFSRGKGIGDKEKSLCYGGLHIHRFLQWCLYLVSRDTSSVSEN